MARMSSKNRSEFDGSPLVRLKDASTGAITVTTVEAPIAIDTLTKAYWDGGEVTLGVATIALQISAIKVSAATETYSFTVQVDNSVTFATPITVAQVTFAATQGKTGFVELPIEYSLVEKLRPGATHMRLVALLGGTLPSVTYGAQLTFIDN
jgi:hypothetical protein